MASCEILRHNGLKNPFSESKYNQMCYNGRFQHDYILEYSAMFHENGRRPTMSFTTLNTAHDWHGLRTQTLNLALVKHIKRMAALGNTLTIFLADHGNTYTPFVRKLLEGRHEMFHPCFFLLVPRGVARTIGAASMNVLRANQNRLFTMLDVNAGLKFVANRTNAGAMTMNRGIFDPIPTNRSCTDLNLRLPNLCVCDGWDNEAANDSLQVSVVEFGVGALNNLIEQQRQKHRTEIVTNGGEVMCHHLVPMYFKNVRERNENDLLITSFDFVVASGKGIDQSEEIFHVETESLIKPGVAVKYIKLLNFDRLSRYGPYGACADKGVDVRLCVCSLERKVPSYAAMSVDTLWQYLPRYPGIPATKMLYNKINDRCVYIVARYFYATKQGKADVTRLQTLTLEAVNLCANKSFHLRITVKPYLMKTSELRTFDAVVHGRTLQFLCVAATENISWPATYSFVYETIQL